MNPLGQPANEWGPEWLAAEMPPGYHNRLAEVQRLSEDLRAMSRFGHLLWKVGDELTDAVRDVFVALRFDAAPTPGLAASSVAVKLDGRRRLLVHVSATEGPIQKKGPEIAEVFQMLQEMSDETDRVVLMVNCAPGTRPADRPEPIEPEALKFLRRLGANVLPAPTLFALWTMSLQDRDRGRAFVERLHAQDGGTFVLPSPVTV